MTHLVVRIMGACKRNSIEGERGQCMLMLTVQWQCVLLCSLN